MCFSAWILHKRRLGCSSALFSTRTAWLVHLRITQYVTVLTYLKSALLRFFASKRSPVQLPAQPGESLDARSESPQLSAREDNRDAPLHTNVHTPALDLGIAKASLAIHALSFALIAVSKNAAVFVAAGLLSTFSTGYGPVVHSLSLELYTLRGEETSEAGRLFGAMNVIQTLGCVT